MEAVVVVPNWSTQYWYPQVVNMKKTNTTLFPAITNKFDVATQAEGVAHITQEGTANGYKDNTTTLKILEASLRISTHNKYNNYIK